MALTQRVKCHVSQNQVLGFHKNNKSAQVLFKFSFKEAGNNNIQTEL